MVVTANIVHHRPVEVAFRCHCWEKLLTCDVVPSRLPKSDADIFENVQGQQRPRVSSGRVLNRNRCVETTAVRRFPAFTLFGELCPTHFVQLHRSTFLANATSRFVLSMAFDCHVHPNPISMFQTPFLLCEGERNENDKRTQCSNRFGETQWGKAKKGVRNVPRAARGPSTMCDFTIGRAQASPPKTRQGKAQRRSHFHVFSFLVTNISLSIPYVRGFI